MSFVLFKDSFERYDVGSITGALLDNMLSRYTQMSNVSSIISNGRTGQAIRCGNSGFAKTLDHASRWVIGFAYRLNQAPTGNSVIYALSNNNNLMCAIYQDADGTLSLRSGAGGATVLGVTSRAINENRWYFIELDMTVGGGTPVTMDAELRINGQVQCSGSGSTGFNDTDNLSGAADANYHAFNGIPGTATSCDFDDIYLKNEAGYEGDIRNIPAYPSGDGGTTDWTPQSGTDHFAMVDSHPVDLTKWLETATVGDIDLWTFTLPTFSGSIVAVNFSVLARKDDEGTKSFKIVCGPTGTDAESDEFFVSDVTPEYYEFSLKLDPTTGVAWVPGATITAGVKLIS